MTPIRVTNTVPRDMWYQCLHCHLQLRSSGLWLAFPCWEASCSRLHCSDPGMFSTGLFCPVLASAVLVWDTLVWGGLDWAIGDGAFCGSTFVAWACLFWPCASTSCLVLLLASLDGSMLVRKLATFRIPVRTGIWWINGSPMMPVGT
jgi:hypothetical protein